MEMLDYTGKLNHHDDYLKMLKLLEKKSHYIEMVLIAEKESNDFIETFQNDIIFTKKVSKWWGTETSAIDRLFRIKASNRLFEYLREFETFCKYFESENGDISEITDFGLDDIAFYDGEEVPLLCTTTHEGFIMIRNDLTK